MKKMTIMCMAALLVMAVSCKKEKVNEEYTGEGFRATTESHTGDGDSKTQLLGNLSVTWCEGDEIKVFSRTDSQGKKFSAANAGTTADFNPVDAVTDAFFSPTYTAFYPYNQETGMNQIALQETQHYTMTDGVLTFALGENPMAAKSNSKVLPFRNLCGILKFQLYSTDECTVKSLCVTSLKEGEQLWGTGIVTFDGTDAILGTLTGGGASITLDCGTGVSLSTSDGTPTEFMFVIPGGALSEGFRVTVTDAEDNVWSKTTTASNTITKSKIKAMPKQSVGTHDPVTPSSVTIAAGCVDCTYTVSGTVEVPSGTHTCEYGLVYSETDATPTIEEGASKLVVNTETFSGTKDFTADITKLAEDVEYYVRAYAMIEGNAYSSESMVQTVTYSTPKPLPSTWTNGKNPHPFTVKSGKVVYFSQGNLQYNATGSSATAASGENVGGTWRFAEHQFDIVGAANANISQTYDGWIDLFGWGTSGYNHGATRYQPWSKSTTNSQYYAYGSSSKHLYSSNGTADWGANAISNGGSSWRTLTGGSSGEWNYLINSRPKAAKLYGEGKVGSCTLGLIILPDDWVLPAGLSFTPGETAWSNVYSYSEWSQMEAAGAVFLPAAGYRNGTSIKGVRTGSYWTSSYFSSSNVCYIDFYSDHVGPNLSFDRYRGFSVRLVSDN